MTTDPTKPSTSAKRFETNYFRRDKPSAAMNRQEPTPARLAHRLLIDLSWNSSRLEGNTYSLLETERLISAGEAASGKDALEAQMILNHKEAIEFLIDSAGEIGFNRYTLLNLHALLSDNLLDDPTASGRLRSIAVGIGQTTFLEGPQRIEECSCNRYWIRQQPYETPSNRRFLRWCICRICSLSRTSTNGYHAWQPTSH